MPEGASRVTEVAALLDLMEKRGILTLRVGDIELSRSGAPSGEEEPPRRILSRDEQEAAQRLNHRRLLLSAGSRIIGRAGE